MNNVTLMVYKKHLSRSYSLTLTRHINHTVPKHNNVISLYWPWICVFYHKFFSFRAKLGFDWIRVVLMLHFKLSFLVEFYEYWQIEGPVISTWSIFEVKELGAVISKKKKSFVKEMNWFCNWLLSHYYRCILVSLIFTWQYNYENCMLVTYLINCVPWLSMISILNGNTSWFNCPSTPGRFWHHTAHCRPVNY